MIRLKSPRGRVRDRCCILDSLRLKCVALGENGGIGPSAKSGWRTESRMPCLFLPPFVYLFIYMLIAADNEDQWSRSWGWSIGSGKSSVCLLRSREINRSLENHSRHERTKDDNDFDFSVERINQPFAIPVCYDSDKAIITMLLCDTKVKSQSSNG